MKHYAVCPVCQNQPLPTYLKVTDHSVSYQTFSLVQCPQCLLVLTQDAPDANEIAPYYAFEDYISHTDTQKGLVNKLYHWVRKYTLQKKYALVQKTTGIHKGAVLDIGAGTGAFLALLQQKKWRIQGLEPDPLAREKAANLYGLSLLENEHLFALPNHSFNAITMWHVLEHVHELDAYLIQIKKLLKTNGALFIAVPNYTSKDARHYKEYWAAYDVPRHLYHFAPETMQRIADHWGFQLEKIKPMWFDSFYVSMLSEKYKKGSMVKALFNGFLSNINAIRKPKECSSLIYIFRLKTN